MTTGPNITRIVPILCLSVLVFICLTTMVLHQRDSWPDLPQYPYRHYMTLRKTNVSETLSPVNAKLDKKYILLWTTFFGTVDWLPSPNRTKFQNCMDDNCIVTSNRNFLNESGVVMFHFADTFDLPQQRRADQYWVIFALESPEHSSSFAQYNDVMNMTATYRLDSDFVTPYVPVRMKTQEEMDKWSRKDYTKNKTKMVAWFVSNCYTDSNREGYANELKKHIEVDVYGGCGNMECHPKMSFDCYNKVSREYYFYLSFENSICKDYVTEKFFHILQSEPGMVPVVLSGADFQRVSPPGAYISAMDFPSPLALATRLKEVASNATLYNSFFDWRKRYALNGIHWICDVCRFINQPIKEQRIKKGFSDWWVKESRCQTWANGAFKYTRRT